MNKKRISLDYSNRKVNLELIECNFFERLRGLMFRSKEKSPALLFDFKKNVKVPIHSFFVFFKFFAIWIDEKNKVVDVKKVSPFKLRVLPKKSFQKIIEIPMNSNYRKELDYLFLRDNSNKKFLVDD